MIKRIKVLYDLFKHNPTVVYCKICNSIKLDVISEKNDNYNYSATLKCKNCGATVDIQGRWKS